MKKVIIAGGRSFNKFIFLTMMCNRVIGDRKVEVVCGMARGVDLLGLKYAKRKGFKIKKLEADWDRLGKSAGYMRNREMADYSDILIAFWDGSSKGTKHMIDIGEEKGLEVHVFRY